MRQTVFATATYRDIWAGDIAATVEAFKTTRRGQRVTRYRWTSATQSLPLAVFATVSGAVAYAERHACFSNALEIAI